MNPTRSILRGDLGKIGLPTLLTIVEMEKRGGILVCQKGKALGRIFLRDGRVLRAQLDDSHRRVGIDAVCEIMGWESGQFELWQARVDVADDVRASTTFLLMEAARRKDEAAAGASGMDAGAGAFF